MRVSANFRKTMVAWAYNNNNDDDDNNNNNNNNNNNETFTKRLFPGSKGAIYKFSTLYKKFPVIQHPLYAEKDCSKEAAQQQKEHDGLKFLC